MRIGIVHRFNVVDVKSLSGYPHFMSRALQDHVGEVTYIGPDDSLLTRGIEIGGKILNRLSFLLSGRRMPADHNRILSKRLGKTFGRRVAKSDCDVIFAPVASAEIAYLKTDIPIVYLSDMTWFNLVDYYPTLSSLWGFIQAEGERLEKASIQKASALIYPSAWVANTAINHYKAAPGKVYCVPFGANFGPDDIPSHEEALEHSLDHGIVLLWVGVDWQRKGGPIAYECLMDLLGRGLEARLVVCGCVPPEHHRHPAIEVIPFLDKGDSRQRLRLVKLFLKASFLLFPTLAEAFGIVICEASACGLPALVRNTGGVGGAVSEGENGYLLAANATGPQYAEKIVSIVSDRAAYTRLVQSSRRSFETRLNWDAWGHAVKPVFEHVTAGVPEN